MGTNIASQESVFRQYARIIFKQKTVILLTFVGVMTSVLISLEMSTPVYESQVKMLISAEKQVDSQFYRDLENPRSVPVSTQSEIVKSGPVIERSIKALHLEQRPLDYEKQYARPLKKYLINYNVKKFKENLDEMPPELQKELLMQQAKNDLQQKIRVEPIINTNLFYIIASDYSPKQAASIANVVSRAYCIFDMQQQLAEVSTRYGMLHPSVMQLQDDITRMSTKLSGEQVSDIEAIGPASVKVIEQARIPFTPVGQPKSVTILIALILSLCLGTGLAILLESMDHSFKSPHDIVSFLNLPFIGSIPKLKFREESLLKNIKKTTLYTQFYQDLAEQIFIFMKTQGLKSVAFVAASPRSGTTNIVANIGHCLANDMEHKTLLIDANLRNPSLHRVYDLPEGPGLANMLERKLLEYKSPLEAEEVKEADFRESHPLLNNQEAITESHLSEAAVFSSSHVGKKRQHPAQTTDTNNNNYTDYILFEKMFYQIAPNLYLLQAGKSTDNPLILLDKSVMFTSVKMMNERFEAILLDCANLAHFKDAVVLAPYVDGVVVIVDEGRDRKQAVKTAIEPLLQKNVKILGIVLNRRTFVIPRLLYKLG